MENNNYEKYKNIIVMDIDDTISFSDDYDLVESYAKAKPNKELINTMCRLSDEGYKFHLYTARGCILHDGDTKKSEEMYRKQIETWLYEYNVPYEKLSFGKPFGILYVDDKAIRPEEFVEKFKNL